MIFMKKVFLLLTVLLLVGAVYAVDIVLTVTWQLSSTVARPNGDVVVYLTATNSGLGLTGVTLTSTPGPYLKIVSGGKIDLGDMPATSSQQSSITLKVDENAGATVSYVKIEAKYYYSTTEYKRIIYIPVTIRRDPILEITNVNFNDTTGPGKTVLLSFDVYNKGDVSARDLNVKLNKTSLFITPSSSGEKVITEIGPMESVPVSFVVTINPEADVGIDNIPLFLTYYDDTKVNNYTDEKNIGIMVSGQAEFVINVDSYENFYTGQMGVVNVYIANRGTGPAEYVSVEAISDFGSKEIYIGSLDSDDSETIDISQDLRGASGKYPIYLTLNYRDKFDNTYTYEKVLELTPTSAPLDLTMLFILAFVVLVGYWLYKRRKKK